jgi:hypothetical protein
MPPADNVVRVTVDQTGRLTREQLLAFLAEECPVGVRVDLQVRFPNAPSGPDGV